MSKSGRWINDCPMPDTLTKDDCPMPDTLTTKDDVSMPDTLTKSPTLMIVHVMLCQSSFHFTVEYSFLFDFIIHGVIYA